MTLRSQANLIRAVVTSGLILAVYLGMSGPALGMGLGWGDDCETTTFQSQVVDQIGLFKSPSRITLTDWVRRYLRPRRRPRRHPQGRGTAAGRGCPRNHQHRYPGVPGSQG
jgi:hypothetical protein